MDCELSSEMGTHPTQSQSRGIGKAKMRCSTEGQRRGEDVSPTRTVKQKVKKGLWSPEEDKKLTNYIMTNGLMGCWSYIAQQAGLQRCSRSCRLRWINYLRPGLKRGAFSLEEERQIIHLQSILGNRWSQIAVHLQGRTDNQIKNYWNCWIKKKIKSKHHTHSTANGVTDTKSNIPSQPHRICNPNSVFAHGLELLTPSDAVQPYLDVILEGQQPPNNTSNVVTTGENEFSVPGVLESIHEEGHDKNLKLSIETDCTSNHLFCRSQVGIYSTSTRTHDCLPAHDFICPSLHAQGHNNYETAKQTDWWTAGTLPLSLEAEAAYTITVPNLSESQLLEEKLKNHMDGTIFNENEIMIDYSLFTTSSGISGWSASNSYSNIAGNCPHLPDPVASPFVAPTAGQFNDFLFVDDYKDGLNLGYDVDLEVSSYSYLWAQNKNGWRVGD